MANAFPQGEKTHFNQIHLKTYEGQDVEVEFRFFEYKDYSLGFCNIIKCEVIGGVDSLFSAKLELDNGCNEYIFTATNNDFVIDDEDRVVAIKLILPFEYLTATNNYRLFINRVEDDDFEVVSRGVMYFDSRVYGEEIEVEVIDLVAIYEAAQGDVSGW